MVKETRVPYLSLEKIIQAQNTPNRKIVLEVEDDKIRIRSFPLRERSGHCSKEIVLKRFVKLDDLFFEGMGLWRGEGGKKKGLYFGNSNPLLLRHFLRFAGKLELHKEKFKVTVNLQKSSDPENTKEKWSEELSLPIQNFTHICVDVKIKKEYAQIYFNSVILAELMGRMYEDSKTFILHNRRACAHFLRGIFAAEGSILLKKSGVLHHITFSSKDSELIQLLEKCLSMLGMKPGKYMINGMNLQIYGLPNFKRFRELGIHTLHPEKRAKFEFGFANYKRTNVLHGEEARTLILQQLASGPKTYDELAAALGKARTTIQAWHIPILEREGRIKRAGKRGRAWLFAPAEDKISPPPNVN